jgi:hypothetical protein
MHKLVQGDANRSDGEASNCCNLSVTAYASLQMMHAQPNNLTLLDSLAWLPAA